MIAEYQTIETRSLCLPQSRRRGWHDDQPCRVCQDCGLRIILVLKFVSSPPCCFDTIFSILSYFIELNNRQNVFRKALRLPCKLQTPLCTLFETSSTDDDYRATPERLSSLPLRRRTTLTSNLSIPTLRMASPLNTRL